MKDLKLNAIFILAYKLIEYVKINFLHRDRLYAIGELHAIYYTW